MRLLSGWRLEAGISESDRLQTAKDMTSKTSSSSSPVPPLWPLLPPRRWAGANLRYSSAHARPHTSCQVKNGVTESGRIGRRESKAMVSWPFHTDDASLGTCQTSVDWLGFIGAAEGEGSGDNDKVNSKKVADFLDMQHLKCDVIKWAKSVYL